MMIKLSSQGGGRGIEAVLQEGGNETGVLSWAREDPEDGTEDAWKSAGLGDNCQFNSTREPQ